MNHWKFWRLIVLLALLGGLGSVLYTRGIPGRLGAVPATLATDYKTEHEWAIRQTALDIHEMAAFTDRQATPAARTEMPLTPWDRDAFTPIAAAAFRDAVAISTIDTGAMDFYPALTALDAAALAESAKIVSQMLAANMRNPRAHESAALVIGAFALREAADWFTDVRWSLNRMTAHLAVAQALRNGQSPSPDGALAHIVLLALSNHHARAIAELGALGSGTPPEPLNAWVRALQLRITRDWRVLPEPATATRLEKLEYFRARRLVTQRRRAAEHLADVNEQPAVDFARIAQDSKLGVEDGHAFISEALEMELDEARRVYQRLHGRPMPEALPAALNHRAARLISDGPQVLPWGAWAEFYQRHIAMNVSMVDGFLRHMLGGADGANQAKRQLDRRLGELTFFPVGTLRRTKGSQGTEADLAYINEIITLAVSAPELIPVRAWMFAELGSRFEPVARQMPVAASWFAPATAAVPFEAGIRHEEGLRAAANLETLLNTAPHDTKLLTAIAKGDPRAQAVKHARGLLDQHHAYDLAALDASLSFTSDVEARKSLQRRGCTMSSRDCLNLANTLLYSGDEKGAAEIYERALDDPQMDDVARAWDSNWLVTYLHRTGEIKKAIALAERAARTGAGSGYYTRGRLYERLGNLDGAEKDFMANALRYDNPQALAAFYYRLAEIDKNAAYDARWAKWRAELFPTGLQPEPASVTGVPQSGVFIYKDAAYLRNAGMRAGDIIVGVDGWRVDTVEQYWTIIYFKDDPTVKFALARGGQLVKIEARSPTRLFGGELQTHPMKGWIKD